MIDSLVEVFKAYLLPGSLSFLLLAGTLAAVLLLMKGRWRKMGRWGLVSLIVLYWAMALPFVSRALVWGLSHNYQAIQTRTEAKGSQAVVVLGGGAVTYEESGARLSALSDASALRALEGARLYKLLDPQWVVVSGGPSGPTSEAESAVLKRAMIQLGIPPELILQEGESGNTYEQAVNLRRLMADHGIKRFVMVTSGVHMPRAMGVFRHAGLDPIPSPAPEHSDTNRGGTRGILPSIDALRTSQVAMREMLGLAYYGVRGWLRPAAPGSAPTGLGLPAGVG
jgi:uncharacterized SAM-binding protein YcdF (DUF218 family)